MGLGQNDKHPGVCEEGDGPGIQSVKSWKAAWRRQAKARPEGRSRVNQQQDECVQAAEEVSQARKEAREARCGWNREGFLEEALF